MARRKKIEELPDEVETEEETAPRPRLRKLIIKNFRSIGSTPVEIELDQIVILVGPNNSGKSSILRAYEVVMSEGSNACKLTLDDFPNGIINEDALPEIELQTVIYDNSVGQKWVYTDEETQENIVREKWIWKDVGSPKRQGYNVEKGDWDEENVPWGAPNVANSKRPEPHRVDAFSNPEEQSKEIIKLLMSVLEERVKAFKSIEKESPDSEEKSEYELLLDKIEEIQGRIIQESQEEIKNAENTISGMIDKVFPGYKVKFDARPQDDLEKTISLFKANPQLLMGPESGYQSTIDRQGSGARRTLLWTALRFISESPKSKKSNPQRPHVLLLDEPELCLHPNAIREACKVLYDLPETANWQVMVTTHSPIFIDLSRDNTTIIRVERDQHGIINGTTLFRPNKANLDSNDRQRLKLLNLCDPYVAEFFFGGRSIIVEGDTEYTAFKYVVDASPTEFKDVHIIRARGKATIVSLIKILNHFGSSYSILHDSDKPFTDKIKQNGEPKINPAWSTNKNIVDTVLTHTDPSKVRLLASIPNFEGAYLGEEVKNEKPYNALINMRENPHAFEKIANVLRALVDHTEEVPEGCIEWKEEAELLAALEALPSKEDGNRLVGPDRP